MEFHFMKQKWFKWVLTFDPPTCTPYRIDKFYNYLDELIDVLKNKGYKFISLRQLINKL